MLAPLLGCGEHPWDGVDTPSSILTGAAVCNIGQPWYSADRSRVGISPMLSQAELFFWNIWTSQEVGHTHSGQSETMWAASVWPHGCCWGWPFYPGRKRGKYCLEVEKIQWSPGVCAKTADVSGEILPPCEESCTGLSRPKKSKRLWNLRKLLLLNSNVIYMCIYLHIPISLLLSIC